VAVYEVKSDNERLRFIAIDSYRILAKVNRTRKPVSPGEAAQIEGVNRTYVVALEASKIEILGLLLHRGRR
jgi:hypothetical protein